MHDPRTCKTCLEKEKRTLSEFEEVMHGSGMFKDFEKKRREAELATKKN